jgi:hypothetical protein
VEMVEEEGEGVDWVAVGWVVGVMEVVVEGEGVGGMGEEAVEEGAREVVVLGAVVKEVGAVEVEEVRGAVG